MISDLFLVFDGLGDGDHIAVGSSFAPLLGTNVFRGPFPGSIRFKLTRATEQDLSDQGQVAPELLDLLADGRQFLVKRDLGGLLRQSVHDIFPDQIAHGHFQLRSSTFKRLPVLGFQAASRRLFLVGIPAHQ